MEYSTNTQVIQTKYNISFLDAMFCQLIAAGADPADSYHAIYNKANAKTLRSKVEQEAKEIIRINPSFNLCIQELKRNTKVQRAKATINTEQEITEEEREKYTTRKGIIDEMIKNATTLTGKDLSSVLQTLTKIQGLDKPEEENEDERRKFVLRWLSHCRSCKLMKLYLEIEKEIEG